jgi:hypothetical protein
MKKSITYLFYPYAAGVAYLSSWRAAGVAFSLFCAFFLAPSYTRANTPPPGSITITHIEQAVAQNNALYHLVFGLQQRVLVEPEQSPYLPVYYEMNPVQAFCPMSAIDSLYTDNELFATVKVIYLYEVMNGDFPAINLAQLSAFENLEYIYIAFYYDACGNKNETCLPQIIQNKFLPGDKNITVLYKSDIPQ